MNPAISVIIPACNAARTLDDAITSIRSQRCAPMEIILVDDGSTDDTAQVAARHPDLVVLRQPNRGPAAARNRGILAAAGEYIAFLDANDLWAPAMLPRLLAMLQEQPATDIVQGLIQRLRAARAAARHGLSLRTGTGLHRFPGKLPPQSARQPNGDMP